MTPKKIQELMTGLPWNEYTVDDLDLLSRVAACIEITARKRKAEIKREERIKTMKERVPLSPDELHNAMTKATIYPPGYRPGD